jgi:hypothetical protein
MSISSTYVKFNSRLDDALTAFENGQDLDFSKLIHKASSLPMPHSDQDYYSLINSGISFSLSDLSFALSTSHLNEHLSEKKTWTLKRRSSKYLTELWDIWERYFIKCCWNHYASILIQTEEFKNKAAFINYHYNKLFNKCGNCSQTKLRMPSEKNDSPKMHLAKLGEAINLTRMTFTGCEGFVYASEVFKNEYVFEKVYSHWKSPDISKMQLLYVPFITCAGELRRKDILLDILGLLKEHYHQIDFTNTIALLYAAKKAGADKILEYFDNLNYQSSWNLLESPNPIQTSIISAFSIKKDFSKSLQREYQTAEAEFWKKYFNNLFQMDIKSNETLYANNKKLLNFNKKDIDQWFVTLGLAQETYVRELRNQMYNEFIEKFSNYDFMNEDTFLREVTSGNVSAQLKKYQQKISALVMGEPVDYSKNDFHENIFLPFIDFLLSVHLSFLVNRESYYKLKKDNDAKASFCQKAERLFKSIKSNMVTDNGWHYFNLLLSNRIRSNVALNLSKIFFTEFHSIKRIFVEKFEKSLKQNDLKPETRKELVIDARAYIKNISVKLPKYKISEPQPIYIIEEIENFLQLDALNYKSRFTHSGVNKPIAGYDGICNDYLRPMFTEIKLNAKKALSTIKSPHLRHYRINLEYGKDELSKFIILTVKNNFLKINGIPSSDPVSTSIGLRNVQYYATFFQKDDLQGWAEFKTIHKRKYGYFFVLIYFPVWTNY